MSKKNQRLRMRHEAIQRKKRRITYKRRIINIKRNARVNVKITSSEKRQRLIRRQSYYYKPVSYTLTAHPNFSLFENTENVISFINAIDKLEKKRGVTNIVFELKDIIKIDIGALTVLLSKINELSNFNITFVGTLPILEEARNFIINSGFLDRMRNLKTGKNFERESKNLIINRGFSQTDNITSAKEIRKSVEHLTGFEENFQPVYSIIVEICSNSIEHANEQKEKKNWIVGTSYWENEVIFTLTDIGQGIIKTIKKKKIHELLYKDSDILINAFNKEYMSRTLDINRNKGLPKIYNTAKKHFIDNLVVISNNVLLDFKNSENTRVLNKNFHGTFYFWKLNKDCIDLWKNRKL